MASDPGGRLNDDIARVKAARDFLDALWPEPPEGGRIVLFELPARACRLFASPPEAAAAAVHSSDQGAEVYVGVCAVREDLGGNGRGRAEDMVAAPGLALDLDVAGERRGKTRLFATLDDARALLDSLPLLPSAVVATGGGLHAWWLFREQHPLRSPRDRESYSAIARGWHAYVKSRAAMVGSELDSVHDIARVLRLPGTINRKYGAPRAVECVALDQGRRYNPSDFEAWVTAGRTAPGLVAAGDLVLVPDAEPPGVKFVALLEEDSKFRRSWEHKRPDLADSSTSGYDASLAAIALRAGWSDQETVNLLIAHRRKWQKDLKLRENYYRRTLENLRQDQATDELRTELRAEIVATGTAGIADDEGRRRVLDAFTLEVGAPLRRVLRFMPRGDAFELHFADARSCHITLAEMTDWLAFWRRLVAAGFSPATHRPKQGQWLSMVNALCAISEPEQVESWGPASEAARLAAELASQWNVRRNELADERSRAAAIRGLGAFAWDTMLWCRLGGLLRIAEQHRQRTSPTELRHALAALGAERRTINARDAGGAQVGGRCWGIPWAALDRALDALRVAPAPVAVEEGAG